ncbi:coenzyme Q-binding protein COQ10 homolog, mitochondrial [Brachionichthys hirsutus]|uniref:coenzyme Q-binding protein COQ10 homolog, mitochondrial n=1 Tax=Brachionichthys hirsutus TaxID=412623 RepID=UPI003604D0D4
MAGRKALLIGQALLEMSEAHSSKVLRGNAKRETFRRLGCFGALAARRTSLPVSASDAVLTPSRSFINLAASINTRRMEYTEYRTMGFTPEQIYSVVSRVDKYCNFVPWCKKSRIIRKRDGDFLAELEIGFPPLVERYTSEVTLVPNHKVRAVCTDGSLFSHLETVWKFYPGDEDQPDSCKVEFNVSFEFKSLLHSQLANVFFDEVVKRMVGAFESRAATLHSNPQGAPLRRWAA